MWKKKPPQTQQHQPSVKAPEGEERAAAVLGAVSALLEGEDGMDEQGRPTLAALQAITGFEVSEGERDAALLVLGEPGETSAAYRTETAGEAQETTGAQPGAQSGAQAPDPLDFANLPESPKPPAKGPTVTLPTTLYHPTEPPKTVKDHAAWHAARAAGYRDLMEFEFPLRAEIHKRAQNTGM